MRIAALIILVSLITACTKAPKYPGFKEVEPGLFIKLVSFDNSEKHSEQSNYYCYEVHYSYADISEVLQKVKYNLPRWVTQNDQEYNLLKPYLKHLTAGDSAVFLIETDTIVGDSILQMSILLKNCYSKKEFAEVYDKWLTNREMNEQSRILEYAGSGGFISSIVQPAVWYRVNKTGEGEPINYGQPITIALQGSFLTNQFFSAKPDTLDFVLGLEGQVIDGLTYGLIGALPGQKRTLLIPSQFAFKDLGSSTGIIPPFTPLLYELEVLSEKVQEKNSTIF